MTVPYLTEERLRVLGFVGDLGDLTSAEIRNLIISASAKVDGWCNAPKLPQPYSFRGGTITEEQHDWSPGDALTPAQRTIYVRHTPIKAVSALRIYVTTTNYTDFSVDELFLNRDLGAIEIISFALTSSAPFGAYVLPNIGLARPQSKTSYTYGYEFTAEDEILEPTDAALYRATNQFWDDTTVEVKIDDELQTEGYTVDRTEGTITFDDPQAADAVVTASYGYTLPQDIAMATGYIIRDGLYERDLSDKGMGNVRSLRVGEIQIDRGREIVATQNQSVIKIPPEAEGHLVPYRFTTIR